MPENSLVLNDVAEGGEAFAIKKISDSLGEGKTTAYVAANLSTYHGVLRELPFFCPDRDILAFPPWDVVAYDRASPSDAILSERMRTLSRLAYGQHEGHIVVTSADALLQRLPPVFWTRTQSLSLTRNGRVQRDALLEWLDNHGVERVSVVRRIGTYAVRGGIIDLYLRPDVGPVRLDLFGDVLERLTSFDPDTQRSMNELPAFDLTPLSELQIVSETMKRFCRNYPKLFGAPLRNDALYAAIREGRRFPGVEHWLPLFYEHLETFFDYLPQACYVVDEQVANVMEEAQDVIAKRYAQRLERQKGVNGETPYHPLPQEKLYLSKDEIDTALTRELHRGADIFPFLSDISPHPDFEKIRAESDNPFDEICSYLRGLRDEGKKCAITALSSESLRRISAILKRHDVLKTETAYAFADLPHSSLASVSLIVAPCAKGFTTSSLAVFSESDFFGHRPQKVRPPERRVENPLTSLSHFPVGDFVVHVEHGVGRFIGLKTISHDEASREFFEIHYADDDKLFVPVENVELLSRYGSGDSPISPDRLGATTWKARRNRIKLRVRDMAQELIKVAAQRFVRKAPSIPESDSYADFVARFSYTETEDQKRAIEEVFKDLAEGRPMDRLICGDVGFGKTEVALRAAYAAVMAGFQVAVVVPTTLLARQHFQTFQERFQQTPARIAQLSRLVSAKERKETLAALAEGKIDVVVGTHAILSDKITFKNLALLVVDEEQRFGVSHKEKIKNINADVHVLTLTATPIPRTLQLAITGLRDLSLIMTPPFNRLPVHTTVIPFDTLSVREALLREKKREGKSFYVCPRIADLDEVMTFLRTRVPELKIGVAHGQMPPSRIEEVMGDFCDGRYDVLLSTTIVEAGLDMPTANTLIVHRAELFGLSSLYQLRGRVGRATTRAYAMLTLPNYQVPKSAEKRLDALRSLTFGGGFQLASQDLDIRGAGNLLGEAQSGHVREVGYELYQQMLSDAVTMLKDGTYRDEEAWSPSINLGTPLLIPSSYVADDEVRMSLYRRIAVIEEEVELVAFTEELSDRFGPPIKEVQALLQLAPIKRLCRRANIGKVDAGPRAVVVAFRNGVYANPAGLVAYVTQNTSTVSIRSESQLVFQGLFPDPDVRILAVTRILTDLARLSEEKA